MNRLKTSIVLLGICLCCFRDQAFSMDLLEAKASKNIVVRINALGGHSEYCAELTLMSNALKEETIEVKPGFLLLSKDTSMQDLLIVERQIIKLRPGGKVVTRLRAFCAAVYNHSPESGNSFRPVQAGPKLVRLANYIDSNRNLISIQSAVWAVANGSNIAGLNRNETGLVRLVSALTGQKIPDYSVKYQETLNGQIVNRPLRIKGVISYSVTGEDMITMQIYDAKGRLRKTIYANRLSKRGVHIEEFDIDVSRLPEGIYFLEVYQQQQRIQRKELRI